MKLLKVVLSILSLSMFATSALADNCVWSMSGTTQPNTSSLNVNYTCSIGGAVAATKTVSTRAVGSTICTISLSAGYSNIGTCDSPNIQIANDPINLPSGTKVCEYDDPVSGTTPGCTRQAVGGGGGVTAYSTSKDGYLLMYVNLSYNSGYCTLSGSSTYYTVSGSCANYRIYRK